MSVLGWIELGVYIVGWLLTTRRIGWNIAFDMGRPDLFDVVMSALFGGGFALFWPVIVPGYYALRILRHFHGDDPAKLAEVLFSPPPESRQQKVERLEQERRKREEYIARLEREVGINP